MTVFGFALLALIGLLVPLKFVWMEQNFRQQMKDYDRDLEDYFKNKKGG